MASSIVFLYYCTMSEHCFGYGVISVSLGVWETSGESFGWIIFFYIASL